MINQIKPFQWYRYVDLFVLQHIAGQQVGFFCECLFAGTWGSDNIIVYPNAVSLLCPIHTNKADIFYQTRPFWKNKKISGRRLGFVQDSANQS